MIIGNLLIFILLGLVIGSFLNAAIWRIHENISISKGRSQCPKCHHVLAVRDLVPVASWLLQRGRCRYCHKSISVQYPVVELITAVLFGISYWVLAPNGWVGWLQFAVWLYILASLILVSVYDLKWMLLPDVVVLPAIVVALVPVVANVVTRQPNQTWLGPLLAGLALGGGFYALAALSKGRWMGGGDIKLVALIGLSLGLRLSLVAMFLAFNLAAIISLALIATRRRKRTDLIPFGPFLALGCIAAMLWGHNLIDWYGGLLTWLPDLMRVV